MKHILVPVDFEPQSLIALEQSYNFARVLKAKIILLYVYELPGGFASFFGHTISSEILYKIGEKLEELAGKVKFETGLEVDFRIESGRVYSKILEVADKLNVSFIVMGTHSQPDEPNTPTGVLGGNSSRVLRASHCPVITINGKHHYKGCRNILLPLDLTKETRQKVTYALEIAKVYGSGIKVVSALWSRNDPEIIQRLNFQLLQVKSFIEEAGIVCAVELIECPKAEKTLVPAILNFALEQGDIDLIVIMTQQELGIVEFFVGSHAQEIIRLSPIPVMSIVPKELGFTKIFS